MTEICINIDWRDRLVRCSLCNTDEHVRWVTLNGPLVYWCGLCVLQEPQQTVSTDTEKVADRMAEVRGARS